MERLFAVIGHPISHSLSPDMHNAVFNSLNLDCHYTIFDVAPEELKEALYGMKTLGFGGINITIPHKVSVLKHLDNVSEEARVIGAINTVKISKELAGYNTDGKGALDALKTNGADPQGKRVLILGSGGAARAIAVSLSSRAVLENLTILGIENQEREKLVRDIKEGTGLDPQSGFLNKQTIKNEITEADILIHATPVGMYPDVNKTLLEKGDFKKDMTVMDIVYNPLETRLMKEAKKAGVTNIISGVDMFVNQGAEALRIWLDIEPPIELMKKTVLNSLKGK